MTDAAEVHSIDSIRNISLCFAPAAAPVRAALKAHQQHIYRLRMENTLLNFNAIWEEKTLNTIRAFQSISVVLFGGGAGQPSAFFVLSSIIFQHQFSPVKVSPIQLRPTETANS